MSVPTIREIAKAVGVSKSTVSAVLRGDPRIPPSTQERVRGAAAKLGHKPDAHLSQLMTYLRRGRGAAVCNLGWLNSSAAQDTWRSLPWFGGYLHGATSRAKELGYTIDEIWTEPYRSFGKLREVLETRGIGGLILPLPQDTAAFVGFDATGFCAVVLDETELDLPLDRVAVNRRKNIQLAMNALRARGFQRLGLWLDPYVDQLSQHDYSSTYLGWCHRHLGPRVASLPQRYGQDERDFFTWVRNWKPDVVITSDGRLLDLLAAGGIRVPEDIGVVHLNLGDDVNGWAGIWQNQPLVGASAVDFLVARLGAHETGNPPHPCSLELAGEWRDGFTVRAD